MQKDATEDRGEGTEMGERSKNKIEEEREGEDGGEEM